MMCGHLYRDPDRGFGRIGSTERLRAGRDFGGEHAGDRERRVEQGQWPGHNYFQQRECTGSERDRECGRQLCVALDDQQRDLHFQ